jgi:protein-S-isoprenylcysteine O-methyltransferase Ste14
MGAAGEFLTRRRALVGRLLALVCLWLAQPVPRWLVIGAGIAGAGLLLRGAAAGYLHKHEQLATSGPYAYTRNPLYLGSALAAAGFLVACRSWVAAAILTAYFALFYPAVIHREEQELRSLYGAAFDCYAARVPLFWPLLAAGGAAGGQRFSWAVYRRNREYQAALGFLAGVALLWLRMRWRG